MSEAPERQGSYIGQAWLVILLALLYAGGLAGVETALSGRIAGNKKNETTNAIPELVEGADKTKTLELLVTGRNGKKVRVYKVFAADGAHLGWVLPASGQGFGDKIELLLGVDPRVQTLLGLYVLFQKETPGLGDAITSASFRNQFKGRSAGKALVVVKSGSQAENEIQALTSATISSESVCSIVNRALANLREPIQQQATQ